MKKTIEIPRELYLYRDAETQIVNEQEYLTPITKLSWDNGIFLYLQGAEFPQKGLTSPETLWAMNMAKRNFLEMLRLLKTFPVSVGFQALFRPKKLVAKLVKSYVEMSWRMVSPFVLKEQYMSPVAQELKWASYSFLNNVDVDPALCDKFSEIFSAMIDYDNAYRYRVEDIFAEAKKTNFLDNPRKEISRLMRIVKDRDAVVPEKFALIAMAVNIVLLHPTFRKAFKVVLSEIDVRKMGLDEADTYWVCIRKDGYKYLGKTEEERTEMLKGKSLPVMEKR